MQKIYNFIVLLIGVFVITTSSSNAQNHIGISSIITNFKDTVVVNQSVSYKVYIKNYGPAVFSGYFRLNTYVDSTYNNSGNFHFSRLDTLFNPVTLQPGDSIAFQTGDTYDLATYKMGGNTVVVWPITYQAGWSTSDSVFHHVFVRSITTELSRNSMANDKMILYPNPAHHVLNVSIKDAEFENAKIEIYDLLGNKIQECDHTTKVDIEDLSKGVYLLQLISTSGATTQQRFVKE